MNYQHSKDKVIFKSQTYTQNKEIRNGIWAISWLHSEHVQAFDCATPS